MPDDLPRTGYVVDGIIAGWLIATDTTRAQIDSIVVDPKAAGRAKWEALGILLNVLDRHAFALGYAWIEGYSAVRSVGRKSQVYGATSTAPRFAYLRRRTNGGT